MIRNLAAKHHKLIEIRERLHPLRHGKSHLAQALGGNTALTSATLDRLLHHAHVVQIRGDSYRPKDKRKSGIIGQQIPVMQAED